MTKEEFLYDVKSEAGKQRKKFPFLRKGQCVFNYVDEKYGVARIVQFEKGIDCFYDDSVIDEFLDACYDVLDECCVVY